MSVSVIIPARNETYLQRTIENVLANAEGEVEVIAICDGYWPEPPIQDDARVVLIHHTVARGQRQSINEAARIAKGKYVMKLDGHSAVDKGFDIKLAADCEYDWTVIPRMYNLDIETWKPKFIDDSVQAIRKGKLHDYMYIGWNDKGEFRTLYYPGRINRELHQRTELIDDTMSCMGPCFFMHKDRFWELGGCDEDHGGWGQQGIEVALKAWLSGGSLKVNKKTWFAHWFRGGGGPGWPYQMSGNAVAAARLYSRDLWLNNKWPLQKRTIEWLVDKFDPPGWEERMEETRKKTAQDRADDINKILYNHIHRHSKNEPRWRGVQLMKFPTDLLLYEQTIWNNKPDFIIECGTMYGASALFFADMLEMTGKGKVISIDVVERERPAHPRVEYITGSSIHKEVIEQVREKIGNGTCMAILDSNHHRIHVKRELHAYAPMITKGQYIVVEDIHFVHPYEKGPGPAVDWFLNTHEGFKKEDVTEQFLVSISRDGWLRRA